MSIDSEIQQLVQKFTADIAALAIIEAQRALEQANADVGRALIDSTAQLPTIARPAKGTSAAPLKAAARTKGEKRPKAELAALRDRLAAYIGEHPGLRVEQLNKGLGLGANEAFRPLKHLLASGTITAKGARRATTYWPSKAIAKPPTKAEAPTEMERIERALTKAQSVRGAAGLLKVSETTLRRTIAKLKISVKNYVQ